MTPKDASEAPEPGRQTELWGYKEVAEESGVAVGTIRYYWSQKRHLLPDPDAMMGTRPGWFPETVRHWVANRPGQGFRSDLKDTDS
ncbi:MarR family transcriptional regulator [Streptomyces sp. NPDC058084]|uniref:MarR family transcriptional regulator n=1 Tax=Streptomyces sp. NPDC058084 TaxID=3346333 RepID=UPI0036EA2FA9